MAKLLALAALASVADVARGIELTPETWDEETAGKTVFVKFQAPWCGHCKSMKKDWDKLMKEYKDSKTTLIADVDCTAAGKDLCETHGVQGFPTIKYGDPADLQDYDGGRDLKALKTFAKENLKPVCSPTNIDLCDAEKKAKIEELMKKSEEDLDKEIETKETELKAAEEHFEAEVKKLQETYESLQKEKTDKQKEIKDSGLGLMKGVKVAKAKGAPAKKEEL